MGRYVIRRLLWAIPVMFVVSLFTFSLIHIAPGDPAILMAMSRYGTEVTPEQIEWIGKEMGLDAPIHVQYLIWMGHLFHGDLGNSIRTDQPVVSELLIRIPVTLQLGITAIIISLLISIPLGIISAVKQYSLFDNIVLTCTLALISFPGFWLALLFVLIFSVKLGLLPVCGRGGIEHIILPVATLALGMCAFTTRLTRTSMLEVLRQDYIRTARAKGLTERIIVLRHALKNALIPVVTHTGIKLTRIFQAAVVIETIFAWEGIGKLMVDSCFARDFPMMQGCILLIAGAFVLINLIVDISYLYFDPRIRLHV